MSLQKCMTCKYYNTFFNSLSANKWNRFKSPLLVSQACPIPEHSWVCLLFRWGWPTVRRRKYICSKSPWLLQPWQCRHPRTNPIFQTIFTKRRRRRIYSFTWNIFYLYDSLSLFQNARQAWIYDFIIRADGQSRKIWKHCYYNFSECTISMKRCLLH